MPRALPILLLTLLTVSCGTVKFGQEASSGKALARCDYWFTVREKLDVAKKCYESVQARFSRDAEGTEAELRLADVFFEQKEYLLAAESYRSFAKLHPTNPELPYAYYRAGLAYMKEGPRAIDRDLEYTEQAIAYFDVGMTYFPSSDYYQATRKSWQEARRHLASRHNYIANFYYKQKEYRAAIPRYAKIADNYRDIGLDEAALYQMARAYLELDNKDKAFEVTAHLKSRYPNSDYLDKLARALGVH